MAPPRHHNSLQIIQWNCRGFRRKRDPLQQIIANSSSRPDIIAIQDANVCRQLPGYAVIPSDSTDLPRVVTYVCNTLHYAEHDVTSPIAHTFIEILPPTPAQSPLFMLNCYLLPRQQIHLLVPLLKSVTQMAGSNPLLIAGDFNCAHVDWGYRRTNHRGTVLYNNTLLLHLTIFNDFSLPTRVGNSVTADTSPDLTLGRNLAHLQWERTQATLGSDHHLIRIAVNYRRPQRKFTARHTNWDQLRKFRQGQPAQGPFDLDTWTTQLQKDIRQHTQTLDTTPDTPVIDSKLAHLLEAQENITRRWRTQKHNRKLKLKLIQLQSQIEHHSATLCKANWAQVCDGLRGNLSTTRAWHLLRHMLDPTQSKTQTRLSIRRLTDNHRQDTDAFLAQVKLTYTTPGPPCKHPEYTGSPQPQLDAPITESEFRAALLKLRNTTPGEDQITNAAIRNLDDASISHLVTYFNECWEAGTLPASWKHGKIIFIAKPHKPITLENIRPISLTSCLGKTFEHIILARLTTYMEENHLFPHSMVGFRAHLSAQDALLQITHDVLDDTIPHLTKAILAVDLIKAFDRIRHAAILRELQELQVGPKTYNYVRAFLSGRTASLHIDQLSTPSYTLGEFGTPQGAVLSPLLFNIALIPLAQKLNLIPHLKHTLYADDITAWTTHGSGGGN